MLHQVMLGKLKGKRKKSDQEKSLSTIEKLIYEAEINNL